MDFGRGIRAQPAKPNIVFIMADDLGYADVSCYGQRDYMTPNIDRLATEGMRFMQAYANSAGLLGHAHRSDHRPLSIPPAGRARGADATGNAEDIGLPPDHPTLPSLLKKAGYGTTLVGKWHLGFLPNFSPLKSGYDHFFGFRGGAVDYFTHHGTAAQRPRSLGQDAPVDRHGYMTNLLGDRAVQTVERYAKSREPFLLSLHFNAPHWPWEGPDDEAESQRIRARLAHRDGGTQETYATHGRRAWTPTSAACSQALDATGSPTTPSSCSPATTAASASPNLAVHRQEDRAARRRPAHPGDRALARRISRGIGTPSRS